MCSRGLGTVLCALTLACSESGPAPSDPRPLPPAEFSLTGRVSDFNTGVSLTGAAITVVDGANVGRATTSGADGIYRLALRPGGFTIRARSDGYDAVFQGVTFVANTVVDLQMRPAMQTLAGTWAGTLSFVQLSTGNRTDVAIPQLTMLQAGNSVSSTLSDVRTVRGQLHRNAARSLVNCVDGRHRRYDDSVILSCREEPDDLQRHGQVHGDCQLDARGDDRAAHHARMRDDVDAVTVSLERQQ
jgi:hypothetical protein